MTPCLENLGLSQLTPRVIILDLEVETRMVVHILTYADQHFGNPDYPAYGLHVGMVETSTLEQQSPTQILARRGGLPVTVWPKGPLVSAKNSNFS